MSAPMPGPMPEMAVPMPEGSGRDLSVAIGFPHSEDSLDAEPPLNCENL